MEPLLGAPPPPGPSGRKRLPPPRERPAPEDDALSHIARQAEARLAAKRAARAEAREIRMKELERQQKEEDTERYNRKSRRYTSVSDEDERMSVGSRGSLRVEERPDKDFERGGRTVSSLPAATLASLGGTSSRRGSGDTSISVDTEASIREIKDSLAEVEEKYKKAMVSNAQLDNEKTNFMYQVDALKDALLELEEQLAESRRQYEEKNKDFEREKHAHSMLQFQFVEVKEILKQREELLAEIQHLQQKQEGYFREMSDLQETIEWKEKKIGKHGIIPDTEIATNGETCDRLSGSSTVVPVTNHAVKVAEDGTLGRAIEMEMENESVENVRKREILQITENEEHTEENEEMEIGQECLDTKMLPTAGNEEAEKVTEGPVISALSLNSGLEEPAKNHPVPVPIIVCYLKNSDVAELGDEGGLLDNVTEVKETSTENITGRNVVNKIDKQNNIADPCIEATLETNTVSEILSEEQNKENQNDILVDEARASNNEETLVSVTQKPRATPSQSEPLKLAEDALTEAASIKPNVEDPCEARKNRENKVVGSDLESQVAEGEGGGEITYEAEWGKKSTDETQERNEIEKAFLRQETKVITSAGERRETPCVCESIQVEFIEEDKQLEMQAPPSVSLQQDLLVEEEQIEQETREKENKAEKSHTEKTKQREALLGTVGDDSEKKNEQHAVEEILSGKTVLDSVSPRVCQIHEERILENDSRKYREMKPEFIPDSKTLSGISDTHTEFAEGHEEDNPIQVKYEPTGEQRTEEQVEVVQESAVIPVTEDIEKVAEGGKADEKLRKAEEMLDAQEAQEVEFRIQEEKAESEDEEAGEEYHEAIDFDEFPSGELNISERSTRQGDEEEKNKQMEEKDRAAEGARLNILKEDCDSDCQDEQLAENNNEQTDQSPANEEIKKSVLTEGDENIQEEKQEESVKAEHLQIDSSVSVSAKTPREVLCNTSGKLLDENNTKETDECTSEQLENLGRVVDESQEETQVSKKGKGKPREDCIVA